MRTNCTAEDSEIATAGKTRAIRKWLRSLSSRKMHPTWQVVLASKGLLACVVLGAVLCAGSFNVGQFRSAYANWPKAGKPDISSRFSTWDTAHYLTLSEVGYDAGSHSCAFYPLWPATIKVGTVFTFGRPVLAGTLVANALSLVALWLFWRLVLGRCGERLTAHAMILFVALPGALFFSFPYTESLYLVILLSFFAALRKDHCFWIGATTFLLPLARPVGVFILLPLAWRLYEQGKTTQKSESRKQIGEESRKRKPEQQGGEMALCQRGGVWIGRARWLLLLSPLLGYAAYFGVMYLWTGNAFEGFEAQRAYPNSPSIKNMFNVSGFWNALTHIGSLDGMMDSLLDRAFFVLVLMLLPLVYRLDKTWFWYTLPAGLVPALTSWFMSYRRYVMVLFPIFIVLAQLVAKTKSRWVFWYYVALMAALQVWAVKQFVNFNWAG